MRAELDVRRGPARNSSLRLRRGTRPVRRAIRKSSQLGTLDPDPRISSEARRAGPIGGGVAAWQHESCRNSSRQRARGPMSGLESTNAGMSERATYAARRVLPDAPFLAAADGRTPAVARCGSCGRRAARCPSTARSGRGSACSSRASIRHWSARSPCSRCAGTASTPRSCSPTSWCRSRPPASISTSWPASVPWSRNPVRSIADVAALPRLVPEEVGAVAQAVQLLTAELGSTPLIGFAGAPFTLGVVPGRGRSEPQSRDARRR